KEIEDRHAEGDVLPLELGAEWLGHGLTHLLDLLEEAPPAVPVHGQLHEDARDHPARVLDDPLLLDASLKGVEEYELPIVALPRVDRLEDLRPEQRHREDAVTRVLEAERIPVSALGFEL